MEHTVTLLFCFALQAVDNKYIPADSQPGLVGGGGKEVYTFKAVGTGPGEVIFTYK